MGKATGWACDRHNCNTFQATEGADPPLGWINVKPQAPLSAGSNDALLLCSNYCAAVVLIERHEAEMGVTFKRPRQKQDDDDG